MESYQPTFLRYEHRSPYSPFFNGIQWSNNAYSSNLPLSYPIESNSQQIFKAPYAAYDSLSTQYPLDSSEHPETSTITSTYTQRSKDHMDSIFGDPSALINQLIDELEDTSSKPQAPKNRPTIYNSDPEANNAPYESETNSVNHNNKVNFLYSHIEECEAPSDYRSPHQDFNFNNAKSVEKNKNFLTEAHIHSTSIQDQYPSLISTYPISSFTERPRQISKNRGSQISSHGLSLSPEESGHVKHNFSTLENTLANAQYEPDLEMLLKQMDRKEFQECWSKDWTLGLIRFCKYMQLSEKMQIGPAIKLKTDDNKCVILVLKKIFQAKPPSGWPHFGVRLQIQCGGYIQDILAWSNIKRDIWKTIMPLIAKGITQLIKKVGGVHKLRNGHQPYFNACRNALREDVSLYSLLKEYSRGVNTKKKRQNFGENEIKETHND